MTHAPVPRAETDPPKVKENWIPHSRERVVS